MELLKGADAHELNGKGLVIGKCPIKKTIFKSFPTKHTNYIIKLAPFFDDCRCRALLQAFFSAFYEKLRFFDNFITKALNNVFN